MLNLTVASMNFCPFGAIVERSTLDCTVSAYFRKSISLRLISTGKKYNTKREKSENIFLIGKLFKGFSIATAAAATVNSYREYGVYDNKKRSKRNGLLHSKKR